MILKVSSIILVKISISDYIRDVNRDDDKNVINNNKNEIFDYIIYIINNNNIKNAISDYIKDVTKDDVKDIIKNNIKIVINDIICKYVVPDYIIDQI